jgi:hypothetical protein
MPELLFPSEQYLAIARSDRRWLAKSRLPAGSGEGGGSAKPGRGGQAQSFVSKTLGSALRALLILTVFGAGVVLLLSLLIPALFITAVLLLIGLSPCLLVAVGMVLTKDIDARDTRTAKVGCCREKGRDQ